MTIKYMGKEIVRILFQGREITRKMAYGRVVFDSHLRGGGARWALLLGPDRGRLKASETQLLIYKNGDEKNGK